MGASQRLVALFTAAFMLSYIELASCRFTEQPVSVVQAQGLKAVLECRYPGAQSYDWRLNGNIYIDSSYPPDVNVTPPYGDTPANVSIPATPQYNNTVVQCEILVRVEGEIVGKLSENATLEVQGPLPAVVDLTVNNVAGNRSQLNVTWVAPFSLNLTTAEPDIQYCMDVYDVTEGKNDLLQSECNITTSQYTFDVPYPVGTQYYFCITPRSNIDGSLNGTISTALFSYEPQAVPATSTTSTTSTTASDTPTADTPAPPAVDNSAAAIGGVITSVIILAFLVVVIVWWTKRKQGKHTLYENVELRANQASPSYNAVATPKPLKQDMEESSLLSSTLSSPDHENEQVALHMELGSPSIENSAQQPLLSHSKQSWDTKPLEETTSSETANSISKNETVADEPHRPVELTPKEPVYDVAKKNLANSTPTQNNSKTENPVVYADLDVKPKVNNTPPMQHPVVNALIDGSSLAPKSVEINTPCPYSAKAQSHQTEAGELAHDDIHVQRCQELRQDSEQSVDRQAKSDLGVMEANNQESNEDYDTNGVNKLNQRNSSNEEDAETVDVHVVDTVRNDLNHPQPPVTLPIDESNQQNVEYNENDGNGHHQVDSKHNQIIERGMKPTNSLESAPYNVPSVC